MDFWLSFYALCLLSFYNVNWGAGCRKENKNVLKKQRIQLLPALLLKRRVKCLSERYSPHVMSTTMFRCLRHFFIFLFYGCFNEILQFSLRSLLFVCFIYIFFFMPCFWYQNWFYFADLQFKSQLWSIGGSIHCMFLFPSIFNLSSFMFSKWGSSVAYKGNLRINFCSMYL